MAPSGEPPVWNTHSATACNACYTPVHEAQSTNQNNASACSESIPSCDESHLTLIVETTDDGDSSPSYKAQSKDETIHEILEEFDTSYPEQEQLYMTTPGSVGPLAGLAGLSVSPTEVIIDKGKGHAIDNSPQNKGNTLSWRIGDAAPCLEQTNEKWDQLDKAINHWTTLAEQGKAEAIQHC